MFMRMSTSILPLFLGGGEGGGSTNVELTTALDLKNNECKQKYIITSTHTFKCAKVQVQESTCYKSYLKGKMQSPQI